ncbi:DUF2330 domain-containing protein [Pseudenhygromyxa sp. WMMC2535]|uniref:DUF2330 domain-containing protein n=1 Tax=Pseudenhygromyxa sp. WMMC2535 TaxID=2712867 RepID=UPI0015578060|nr:DUF2330 domain-containing protein [Pseudenhygromyxa sp. WMMC2535]NVB38439.1 DUF2330 domain-containing protein [Pseudenhygromyxa sp. WMMC2535]
MTRLGLAALAPLTLAAFVGLAGLSPGVAHACGGTFCDAGPQVMPVDQSGESILFWIDQAGGEAHTEAHIQIQYEGDPERFAWLIPVVEVPEVLVGSQALFDNLLAATVPTFTINTRFDGDCGSGVSALACGMSVDASEFAASDDDLGGTEGFGDELGEGPEILERGFAGAFEYVILTGDSVDEIVDWLDAAGYAQDDDAPPILAEYLAEGHVFVAIKLRSDAGSDEIHPLALRYPGVEPCIPIRLTRIAATEDMAIRAFFLGESRVAPQNWPHVVLNLLGIDWVGDPAGSYLEQVSLAIDEAGGRAFVTEYAGSDEIVSSAGIRGEGWSAAAFAEIEAVGVVDELRAQGFYVCSEDWLGEESCAFTHPLVEPLLDKYLPAPEGVETETFWDCLSCYEGLIDPVSWGQQPGFAAEFAERITIPADHALEMLDDASYLTRLFSLISPHEMLEDPVFHEVADLPEVSSSITATRVFACDDSSDWFELDEHPDMALDALGGWPSFEDMPAARRVERVPTMGPPQVEVDNDAGIDDILDSWNHSRLTGPSPWNCATVGLRPEGVLTMLMIFGIAGLQRRRRAR